MNKIILLLVCLIQKTDKNLKIVLFTTFLITFTDSVKTLLAKEGGVNLVCLRLEQLVQRNETGDMNTDDSEVIAVMKQACDLVIIVLTGGKQVVECIS